MYNYCALNFDCNEQGNKTMVLWLRFSRTNRSNRFFILIFLLIFTTAIISGCNMPMPAASTSATADHGLSIASPLREFYFQLNGNRYLGPAISTSFEVQGSICQYTTNALLCINPVETDPARRFYLVPLGQKLGVNELPDTTIEPNSPFMINGYRIYPAFMAVYNDLRGDVFIGPPLSNVRYNQQAGRIEQYFQNAGFYISLTDPDARVELLPYGQYVCKTCQGAQKLPAIPEPPTPRDPSLAFSNGLDRLGGTHIFGKALSQTYTASDGNLEQVFETVALYASKQTPEVIRFRPLAVNLGMRHDLPRPQQYDRQNNMIFYNTQGELGYHVPVDFDHFIFLHGGTEFSGQPISEPAWDMQGGKRVVRQCFVNYCLDYDPDAPQDANVRLAPLGTTYLQQAGLSAPVQPTAQPLLQLLVSEMLPQPRSTDTQMLMVNVFQQGNNQPAANLEVIVTLTTSNGLQHSFYSLPTNENGATTITVPPLPGSKHGDMITYQVCLTPSGGQPVCQSESYLIWDLN